MPRRPLSILFVGTLPPQSGGATVVNVGTLLGLVERRHRLQALAPVTRAGQRQANAFALAHPDLHVTRYLIPYWEAARGPVADDQPMLAVHRAEIGAALPSLLARARPEVVLVGQESLARAAADPIRAHGLASVLAVHGGSLYMNWLAGSEAAGAGSLREIERFDTVVAVARHLAEGLESLGLPRVHTALNRVDVRRFRPSCADPALRTDLGIDDGDVVVLHVSNLLPFKRPLDLVEAVGIALRRDPRLRVLILGDGPGRAGLEAACRRRGILDRFRFVGWVEHGRMPDFFALADLVVQTSAFEGRSLVSLESQACARLLVASDTRAAREVVDHGTTGLVFPVGDAPALAALIEAGAADPELRRRIGTAARAAAEASRECDPVDGFERALVEAIDVHRHGGLRRADAAG